MKKGKRMKREQKKRKQEKHTQDTKLRAIKKGFSRHIFPFVAIEKLRKSKTKRKKKSSQLFRVLPFVLPDISRLLSFFFLFYFILAYGLGPFATIVLLLLLLLKIIQKKKTTTRKKENFFFPFFFV